MSIIASRQPSWHREASKQLAADVTTPAGLFGGDVDQDGHPQHLAQHQQLWLTAPEGGGQDALAVATGLRKGSRRSTCCQPLINSCSLRLAQSPTKLLTDTWSGLPSWARHQPQSRPQLGGRGACRTASPQFPQAVQLTFGSCPQPPQRTPPAQTRCVAWASCTAPPPPPAAAGLPAGEVEGHRQGVRASGSRQASCAPCR